MKLFSHLDKGPHTLIQPAESQDLREVMSKGYFHEVFLLQYINAFSIISTDIHTTVMMVELLIRWTCWFKNINLNVQMAL